MKHIRLRAALAGVIAAGLIAVSGTPAAAAAPTATGSAKIETVGCTICQELSGDWDGDGIDTPGLYDSFTGNWYLRNSNSTGPADLIFRYGTAYESGTPIVGDWDGNGTDTPGLVRNSTWLLRNSNSAGLAHIIFDYGSWEHVPIVGDWNGDGMDTAGYVDHDYGTWYLRNSNSAGPSNLIFRYGDVPIQGVAIAGDWDGNGSDTPGLVLGTAWHLRNSNSAGPATVTFDYGVGSPHHWPLTGDWDGNGTDTPGVVDHWYGSTDHGDGIIWLLRNSNSAGFADITFTYGPLRF